MTAKTQSPLTVYYDGACPVCRREIGFYQKRTGGAVSYCDVATEASPAPDLDREAALKRFHVRLPDGALVSGAAVALGRADPVGDGRKLRPEIGDHAALGRARGPFAPRRHAMHEVPMHQHRLAR